MIICRADMRRKFTQIVFFSLRKRQYDANCENKDKTWAKQVENHRVEPLSNLHFLFFVFSNVTRIILKLSTAGAVRTHTYTECADAPGDEPDDRGPPPRQQHRHTDTTGRVTVNINNNNTDADATTPSDVFCTSSASATGQYISDLRRRRRHRRAVMSWILICRRSTPSVLEYNDLLQANTLTRRPPPPVPYTHTIETVCVSCWPTAATVATVISPPSGPR